MHCNQDSLQLLVRGDDQSEAFKLLSQHVDTCAQCQAQLLNWTDEPVSWWPVAKQTWMTSELPLASELIETKSVCLRHGETEPETEPDSFDKSPILSSLSAYLSPGAHPELLGRMGRYDVERIVGHGGMGVVLKGYDSELHRVVAIKVMLPALASNSAARLRFAREARATAAVVHPHVIPIYDVQSEAELPYLVMQFVSGPSLQSRVESRGPLSISDTLRVAQQAASGLAAAHAQGLVHRDVKPANMLLEESVERVVLSDFGLARTLDDASLTRTGVIAGTPHYMSPEQAIGDKIDFRSDLFGLGSVMYFMLTGHPPFRADGAMAILNRICHSPHRPLEQLNGQVPWEVARLVDRLLSKQPQDRFADASEVEQQLKRLLALLEGGCLSLVDSDFRNSTNRIASLWKKICLATVLTLSVAMVAWSVFLFRPLQTKNAIDEAELARVTEASAESVSKPELTVKEWRNLLEQDSIASKQAQEWTEQATSTFKSAAWIESQWKSPVLDGSNAQHQDLFLYEMESIRNHLNQLRPDETRPQKPASR